SSTVPHPYLHSFPTRRSSDLSNCAAQFGGCRPVSSSDYFFIKSSTAAVMATMPVRIVGSGIGANLLECKLGNGAAPGFLDSAILDRKSTRLNSSHLGISYAVF